MRAPYKLLIAGFTVACVAVTGCTARKPTPRPAPTPTPAPTQRPIAAPATTGHYPPETRTGDRRLDQVIDATLKQQIDRLTALLHLSPVPCSGAGERGLPKCEMGVPDKSLVPAFARETCEREYVTEMALARETLLRFKEPLHLHSVIRTTLGANTPAFGIVFVSADLKEYKTLYVNEQGQIIGANLGCAGAIPMGEEYFLPPKR